MEHLQYPIGKLKVQSITLEEVPRFVEVIRTLPEKLKEQLAVASPEALQNTYREGSWNVVQLVHHLADSHMNSFIRFKLALSEDHPSIKPYDENAWAEMVDSQIDYSASLQILDGVHARWTVLLESFTDEQFRRTFYHPESKQTFSLYDALQTYAWHSEHHLAHIRIALQAK